MSAYFRPPFFFLESSKSYLCVRCKLRKLNCTFILESLKNQEEEEKGGAIEFVSREAVLGGLGEFVETGTGGREPEHKAVDVHEAWENWFVQILFQTREWSSYGARESRKADMKGEGNTE